MCENNKTIDSVVLNVLQTCLAVTLATFVVRVADYISDFFFLRFQPVGDEEDEEPITWRTEGRNI